MKADPVEQKSLELRGIVREAADAAMEQLLRFDESVRALAVKQLVVDLEIRTAARSLLMPPSPAGEPRPLAPGLRMLTVQQVAERCQSSNEVVKRWLRSGILKRTKAGGRTLVRESDLDAFLKR